MDIANKIFEAQAQEGQATEEFIEFFTKLFGYTEINWDFDDFHFDWYDRSFELKGIRDTNFKLTEEQQDAFWAEGFFCGWLNYTNGTERYYSTSGRYGTLKDKKTQKYLEEVSAS